MLPAGCLLISRSFLTQKAGSNDSAFVLQVKATLLSLATTCIIMKWLNALGLLLQFLSFWFAAPELLGDSFLKRMQGGLKAFVTKFSVVIIMIVVLGYGLTFSFLGIMKGMRASEMPIPQHDLIQYYTNFGFATVAYLVFILNYKKIKTWLDERVSAPLIEKLIQNPDLRKNALITGAIIFTLGFLIQFAVIIFS